MVYAVVPATKRQDNAFQGLWPGVTAGMTCRVLGGGFNVIVLANARVRTVLHSLIEGRLRGATPILPVDPKPERVRLESGSSAKHGADARSETGLGHHSNFVDTFKISRAALH